MPYNVTGKNGVHLGSYVTDDEARQFAAPAARAWREGPGPVRTWHGWDAEVPSGDPDYIVEHAPIGKGGFVALGSERRYAVPSPYRPDVI